MAVLTSIEVGIYTIHAAGFVCVFRFLGSLAILEYSLSLLDSTFTCVADCFFVLEKISFYYIF